MRILLDECVASRLANDLIGHHVVTVQRMAWGSLSDGEILRRAANEFDVFLTVDRSLERQQNVPSSLILITLISRSIEYQLIRTTSPEILHFLESARPGERIRITRSLTSG